MRISEVQLMKLLSILDGTLDDDYEDDIIGGYTYDTRRDLWVEINDQQSYELVDLESGGKVIPL